MEQLWSALVIIAAFAVVGGLAAILGTDSRSWEDPRPWWPGQRGSSD